MVALAWSLGAGEASASWSELARRSPELPTATARGVETDVDQIPIAAVDPSALPDASAIAPQVQDGALSAAGVDASALNSAPEILTGELSADRFDAIGVSWAGSAGPPPAVWVRVEEARGWSEWRLLPVIDAQADDGTGEGTAGPARTFTEPLLTGGATAFQVRIDSSTRVRSARVDVVDAGEGPGDAAVQSARPASRRVGSTRRSVVVPAEAVARATTAGMTVAQPSIITRSQWGADESLRRAEPSYSTALKVGVVHHTATTNGYGASTAAAQLRSIYAYHTQSLGWNDIAYNFLVDRDGRVFEGRAGGIDKAVLSGATGGFNRFTFSVSALGDFSQTTPPTAMVESMARLMAWKYASHYINPAGSSQLTSAGADTSRYPAGQTVTVRNVIAHRDTNITGCPGEYLYERLDWMRTRIQQLLPAGLDHPAMTPTYRTPAQNGSVRVTSGMLYGGNWNLTVTDLDGRLVWQQATSGHSIDTEWRMVDQSGAPVPSGTYRLKLTTEQNGVLGLPFEAVLSTATMIGNLEDVSISPAGTFASGWAAASDGGAATVALVTDGPQIVRVPATDFRGDVGAVYPLLGPARGFRGQPALSPGRRLVCAWAERPELMSTLIGCRWVDELRAEPVGNVESAEGTYGGVRVAGWMLDRHTPDPITARFYLDGRHGGDVRADRSRPDVGRAYSGYGSAHGFSAHLAAGPGLHSICVNGINVGPGTSEGHLRCVYATPITGAPIGNFEQLSIGPSAITVRGWTLDPDATAPISVHVYVDGYNAGAFPASGARPDLTGPYPLMGSAHGFEATVGMATGGRHTVCVYAINVGPPAANPLLNCSTYG